MNRIHTSAGTIESCIYDHCGICNATGFASYSEDNSGNLTQQLQSVAGNNYAINWGYDAWAASPA